MAWIETKSGIALQSPEFGSSGFTISTMVDGGRNGNGDFIGQVIGNDKLKIELSFAQLSPDELMRFLRIFDRRQGGAFVNEFRVFDPRINDFKMLSMYIGDRSGVPYLVNPKSFKPSFWRNVKANLIEL